MNTSRISYLSGQEGPKTVFIGPIWSDKVILGLWLRRWAPRLYQLVISDLNWGGGSSYQKWWCDSLRDISKYWGNLSRLVQFVIQGQNLCDKTTQNMKQVILKTFKWSSFGLLKATKLVIIKSLFCNFSMNTKPGLTATFLLTYETVVTIVTVVTVLTVVTVVTKQLCA